MVALLAALAFAPDPIASAFSPAGRDVLAHPDRVTIYAVEPSPFVAKPSLGFRDALGARRLDRAQGKAAVNAMLETLRDVKNGIALSCFEPHHGLKIERGRRWIKAWVCFTCRQTEIEESGGRHVAVASGRAGREVLDRLVPKVAGRRPVRKPAP